MMVKNFIVYVNSLIDSQPVCHPERSEGALNKEPLALSSHPVQ